MGGAEERRDGRERKRSEGYKREDHGRRGRGNGTEYCRMVRQEERINERYVCRQEGYEGGIDRREERTEKDGVRMEQ